MSVLTLGCFLTFLNIFHGGGMYLESVGQFNFVPPLSGQIWLPHNWLNSFNGHGLLYLCGLITLFGAWLPLARPDLEENARSLLAFGLVTKAMFLVGDVRLWSANELAHLAAGASFLSGRSALPRVRFCLGLVAMSGAATDLWLQGWSPLVCVQGLAAAVWMAGGRYWKWAAGALFAVVACYGMIGISYRMVTLLPLVWLSSDKGSSLPPQFSLRYLPEFGLVLICLLSSRHGLLMLGPNRVPIRVNLEMSRGSEHYQLALRYPRRGSDFTDSRVGITRIWSEAGRRRRAPIQEPLVSDGVVLFEPSYFNSRPEALREPYLYRFYAEELERRWHPEQLTLKASWGSVLLFDRRLRSSRDAFGEESDSEADEE